MIFRLYTKLRDCRDWVFAKIDYLQSESAKWQRAWGILKGTFRLAMEHKQVAIGLVFAGSVGGYAAADAIIDGYSFSRGDAGIYEAPLDAPIYHSGSDNTLRIDLGTTPVGEITIEDVTIGTVLTGSTLPSGETSVVFIGGLSSASTYLEVGHLVIDRWRCTQLKLDDVEAYELNVKFNASDGQSIAPVAGTPRARGISGGNRADAMTTSGGTYDQVKIQAPSTSTNGKVDKLTLRNLYTEGGLCLIDRVKAGIIDVIYGEYGAGDGFAAKDFTITASTTYKSFNNVDNVEVSISPP